MSEPEVICRKRGAAGHILLNRPQALNALTLGMVRDIAAALDAWERDPEIKCVVVEGAGGKAFCAGGDIRLLYDQGQAGDHAAQRTFWREEYILNRRIKRYPKPYVALVDGIDMGGGVGVSLHGSHRIAGDRFLFAMPEVGIGFFPDVGATYFLPRLPGKMGTYLAITGARVGAGDAVALGIATAYVPSAKFAELADALCAEGDVDAVVKRFAAPAPASPLMAHEPVVDRCFDRASVAEVLAALEADGSDFARETREGMRGKSPTSMAVALKQMQEGGRLEIEGAMILEYRIVSRLCHGVDFYEGVRATIVDKDKNPKWRPATVAQVRAGDIDAMFAPLGAEDIVFDGKDA